MNDIPEETDMTQTNSGHHDADDMEMDEDKRDLLVAAFLEQQHLHHDHYGIASDLSINQQMTSPGGQDPDLIPLSSKLLMYHHHEDDGSNGNNSDCLGSSLASNDQSSISAVVEKLFPPPNFYSRIVYDDFNFSSGSSSWMDSEVYEAGQQQPSSLTTGRVTEQQHDSLDCMLGLLGPPPEVVMNAAMSSGPLYLSHQHDLQGTSLLCHPTSSSSSSHEMNLKSVVSGQSHHHHHPSHLQQQPLHSILKTSTSQSIFPPLPPTSSSSLSNNLKHRCTSCCSFRIFRKLLLFSFSFFSIIVVVCYVSSSTAPSLFNCDWLWGMMIMSLIFFPY